MSCQEPIFGQAFHCGLEANFAPQHGLVSPHYRFQVLVLLLGFSSSEIKLASTSLWSDFEKVHNTQSQEFEKRKAAELSGTFQIFMFFSNSIKSAFNLSGIPTKLYISWKEKSLWNPNAPRNYFFFVWLSNELSYEWKKAHCVNWYFFRRQIVINYMKILHPLHTTVFL